MDKIIKWGVLAAVFFFACASAVTILVYNVTDFSLIIPTNTDLVVIILLFISSIIAFLLASRLFLIVSKRHNYVTQILLFIFLCDGAAAMFEVIRGFVRFQDVNFDRLFVNSFYYIFCLGTFFTAYFVVEVFYAGVAIRKNKIILTIIGIALAAFTGFILKEVYVSGSTAEVAFFGIIFLITVMFVNTTLTRGAYLQSRRLEDRLAQRGFHLISLGGLSLTASFSFLFLFYLFKSIPSISTPEILNWIAQSFIVASMLFLYIGFTKPMKPRSPSLN